MHSAIRSLLAWVVLGASAPLVAPAAEIVDFEFTPTDISADGSVVVGYRQSQNGNEAVRWTEAEGTTALGSFWIDPPDAPACGGGFEGWGTSEAWAVSGDGETIVGNALRATDAVHNWVLVCFSGAPVRFDPLAALGLPGLLGDDDLSNDHGGYATAASFDASVIVGWQNIAGTYFGVVLSPGAVATICEQCTPSDVSADGAVIVGNGVDGGFRATAGGLETGIFGSIVAVSADGSTMVGTIGPDAYRWTETGPERVAPPGGIFVVFAATDVSGDGARVVGLENNHGVVDAWIWEADGGFRLLREWLETERGLDFSSEYRLWTADGVSADGRFIMGTARRWADNRDVGVRIDTLGTACDDGDDNDGDGLIDLADPGCSGPDDARENSPALACDDGISNDGDGLVDFRVGGLGDPGCSSPTAPRENPLCQNGLDDDGDGKIDFDGGASANGGVALAPPDPQCTTPYREQEKSNCGLGGELPLAFFALHRLLRRRRGRAER